MILALLANSEVVIERFQIAEYEKAGYVITDLEKEKPVRKAPAKKAPKKTGK